MPWFRKRLKEQSSPSSLRDFSNLPRFASLRCVDMSQKWAHNLFSSLRSRSVTFSFFSPGNLRMILCWVREKREKVTKRKSEFASLCSTLHYLLHSALQCSTAHYPHCHQKITSTDKHTTKLLVCLAMTKCPTGERMPRLESGCPAPRNKSKMPQRLGTCPGFGALKKGGGNWGKNLKNRKITAHWERAWRARWGRMPLPQWQHESK